MCLGFGLGGCGSALARFGFGGFDPAVGDLDGPPESGFFVLFFKFFFGGAGVAGGRGECVAVDHGRGEAGLAEVAQDGGVLGVFLDAAGGEEALAECGGGEGLVSA